MWGSDQAASLEPSGLTRLLRDIRLVETSHGQLPRSACSRREMPLSSASDSAAELLRRNPRPSPWTSTASSPTAPSGGARRRGAQALLLRRRHGHRPRAARRATRRPDLRRVEPRPAASSTATPTSSASTTSTRAATTRPTALREFAEASRHRLSQICYIGDDVIDLPALELAGLAAVARRTPTRPSSPRPTTSPGPAAASGAVREIIDLPLRPAPRAGCGRPYDSRTPHVRARRPRRGARLHAGRRRRDAPQRRRRRLRGSGVRLQPARAGLRHRRRGLRQVRQPTRRGGRHRRSRRHQRDHRRGRRVAGLHAGPLHLRPGQARRPHGRLRGCATWGLRSSTSSASSRPITKYAVTITIHGRSAITSRRPCTSRRQGVPVRSGLTSRWTCRRRASTRTRCRAYVAKDADAPGSADLTSTHRLERSPDCSMPPSGRSCCSATAYARRTRLRTARASWMTSASRSGSRGPRWTSSPTTTRCWSAGRARWRRGRPTSPCRTPTCPAVRRRTAGPHLHRLRPRPPGPRRHEESWSTSTAPRSTSSSRTSTSASWPTPARSCASLLEPTARTRRLRPVRRGSSAAGPGRTRLSPACRRSCPSPGPVSMYTFTRALCEALPRTRWSCRPVPGNAVETFLLAYHAKAGQRVFLTTGLGAMGLRPPGRHRRLHRARRRRPSASRATVASR